MRPSHGKVECHASFMVHLGPHAGQASGVFGRQGEEVAVMDEVDHEARVALDFAVARSQGGQDGVGLLRHATREREGRGGVGFHDESHARVVEMHKQQCGRDEGATRQSMVRKRKEHKWAQG